MSAPNPAPAYRPERPRSIFGPIMLVAIGITLLLCTTGRLSWHSFWLGFARYWPAVLIFWGVAKLAEYMWAKQKGYRPPRLGAGSIVFLIFFVLFGITTTRLAGIDWSGVRNEIGDESDVDFLNIFGSDHDFTDNFSQPMPSPGEIKVLGRRGDITVKASADGQAHVSVSKSLRTESQSDADRVNQSTRAKFEHQGNIWILDLSNSDFNRGRFNLDLELPPGSDLSISTHIGNISVEQRPGNVNLATDHGDISVEELKGDATVTLKRGSLTANNITGNMTVGGTVTDSNITGLSGTLTMTGTYWGDMQLSHIAKQVHFTSSRTDLQFARLDGEFNMQPDNLRANAVSGPFKLDARSGKSVHLEDVSGDIHIDNRNGSVEVSPKGSLGNIDVTNVHGEIDLTLSPNASFQLDAQSLGGEIQSDFGVNVDNRGDNATARGTVGKGGPVVRLKADHGTIQLKKQ
jgi:DUF4097 and DUF4098 domain-containing protein YvlB